MIRQAISEPQITLHVVNDPAEIARCQTQDERAKRNSDWLQTHWATLLPQARGKFIAVAGQEAFIADTAGEAWRMARAAHPEDDGEISQYVFPRIYGYRREPSQVQ